MSAFPDGVQPKIPVGPKVELSQQQNPNAALPPEVSACQSDMNAGKGDGPWEVTKAVQEFESQQNVRLSEKGKEGGKSGLAKGKSRYNIPSGLTEDEERKWLVQKGLEEFELREKAKEGTLDYWVEGAVTKGKGKGKNSRLSLKRDGGKGAKKWEGKKSNWW